MGRRPRDPSPKTKYKWPTDTRKYAQHCQVFEKRESKAQRYYLMLVRRAIIKKSTINKCRSECGERTLLHCWWECELVQSIWKTG